ncbi:MAG: hypothetical protein BHK79_00505 [Halanaerobium sp. MDAL1]|nr:MAG: hypothetical protein BHK79_00505 [Halanaerobium sp. MDAL1]
MEELTVKMRDFYSEDVSLVNVETLDDNKHSSVRTEDGKVLVFEYIPFNDPSWCFYVEKNMEDYYNSIKKVDWIMDNVDQETKEVIEDTIKETKEKTSA